VIRSRYQVFLTRRRQFRAQWLGTAAQSPGRVTPVHPIDLDDGRNGMPRFAGSPSTAPRSSSDCSTPIAELAADQRGGVSGGQVRLEGCAVFEASYEIRVKGRLSDALQAAFQEFEITTEPVETVLHGQALDQAALHGLLDRIQTLGLELVEVRRLAHGSREPAGEPTQDL